jgi:hypothetical protein
VPAMTTEVRPPLNGQNPPAPQPHEHHLPTTIRLRCAPFLYSETAPDGAESSRAQFGDVHHALTSLPKHPPGSTVSVRSRFSGARGSNLLPQAIPAQTQAPLGR